MLQEPSQPDGPSLLVPLTSPYEALAMLLQCSKVFPGFLARGCSQTLWEQADEQGALFVFEEGMHTRAELGEHQMGERSAAGDPNGVTVRGVIGNLHDLKPHCTQARWPTSRSS